MSLRVLASVHTIKPCKEEDGGEVGGGEMRVSSLRWRVDAEGCVVLCVWLLHCWSSLLSLLSYYSYRYIHYGTLLLHTVILFFFFFDFFFLFSL